MPIVALPSDDEEGPTLPSDDDGPLLPQAKRRRNVVRKKPAGPDGIMWKPSGRKKPAGPDGIMWKPSGIALPPTGCAVGEAVVPPTGCAVGEPLNILELFSGTGSVGAVFASWGHRITSVDLSDASGHAPTHKVDILEWNYTEYACGDFDVIWASPPCEHYSLARTTAKTPRNLVFYDSLVAKTLEIVAWFQPKFFFVENPRWGLLRTREVVKHLPYKDVDYCKYGTVYQKPTRLWGHFPTRWAPRPLCRRDCDPCGLNGKHPERAQRGNGFSVHQLHRVPAALVSEICEACSAPPR